MLDSVEKTDPRVKRTRRLLQDAVLSLVHEKPMDAITVQDIAARAEVNRATFYAHFEDKNALMNYMMREMFQERLDAALPPDPPLTRASLRALILITCDYLGEFIGHCAPVRQWNDQAVIVVQVQPHLAETLQRWLRKTSVPEPEMVAATTSWAIWGTVFQWARAGRKIPADQLTDQLLDVLQNGLYAALNDEVPA